VLASAYAVSSVAGSVMMVVAGIYLFRAFAA
jgi:multidrug transporter EmrE-like cation transporter